MTSLTPKAYVFGLTAAEIEQRLNSLDNFIQKDVIRQSLNSPAVDTIPSTQAVSDALDPIQTQLQSLGDLAGIDSVSLDSGETVGVLPLNKGGTGGNTVELARQNLGILTQDEIQNLINESVTEIGSVDLGSPQVTNVLPVVKGGTGANTPSQARANLGVWSSVQSEVVKTNTKEALRRSYAEAGYNVVGTFQTGFTYVNANDVGIDETTGKGFTGPAGTVAAGTDPASGGFTDVSVVTLYSTLSDINIANYANAFNGSDDTDALIRFLTDSVSRGGGTAKTGAVYTITRPISITVPPDTDVQIDMRGSVIRYITPLGADQRIYPLTFAAANHSTNTGIELRNIVIDCDVPYFESTTPSDRRGIGGVMFSNIDRPKVNGWRGRNMFYSAGIMAKFFNSADFQNVLMEDVGSKYRPNADDTSAYDAAGDAVHLLDAVGVASTSIRNIKAKSYDGKIGRAGVVCEELTSGITTSHVVTIDNGSFDGYQRIIHQEDHGKSKVTWKGGKAKRFSNAVFNLSGIGDDVCCTLDHVDIEVDPPFAYGGTAGLQNYQSAGRSAFNDCNIKYLTAALQDRGSYTVDGGSVDLGTTLLIHVTAKDVTYDGVRFAAAGGTIMAVSGTELIIKSNCKLANAMTVHVDSNGSTLTATDSEINEADLIFINCRARPVSIVNCLVTPNPGTELLAGSANSVVNFGDCDIKNPSTTQYVTVYGDGGVDVSYRNCRLTNVLPIYLNGGGEPDGSDLSQINGCKITAVGSIGPLPFIPTTSAGLIVQATTFIDKTVAQGMTVPASGGLLVTNGVGNVLIKNAGVTLL